jgi:hypothetical protein
MPLTSQIMSKRMHGGPVAGLLGEPDAIVCETGMDPIGRGREHVLWKVPSRAPVSLFNKLRHGEPAGLIEANEKM